MTHARSSLSRQRLYDACEDGRRGGAENPSSRTGRGSASARSYRFQHSLIVVETALAVLLLTMGGLLLQTFHQLRGVDLGIRRENVLTFVTPLFRYRDFDRRVAFVNAELEKMRAIPGVTHAAAISRISLAVTDQSTFYRLAGQSNDDARVQVALSRVKQVARPRVRVVRSFIACRC
jgi:hypothetical protein